MREVEVLMLANRQKVALENIDLLETLRVLKLFFPLKYKERVIQWEEEKSNFYNHLCDERKLYQIPLSFSTNCGTFFDNQQFETRFEALEYSLINALNGRETRIKSQCNNSDCELCSY